ncbi:TAP-like protein-domain-containing protein [Aspergillus granulosus]|uniref:TAP-like protein-domain-containing protein n=1 Tax=Aspergillus granulosus TaxID=176169 RepID=A0ABR4H1K1_9EURO
MVSFRALLPTLALWVTAECTFNWTSCDPAQFDSSTVPVPFQCGTLDVPFDYTSRNSSEKLRLQLIKAPAPLESKGTILFNMGGPGVANRNDFSVVARNLIPLTGGQYDLVTFDTRGTVDTIPLRCHNDPVKDFRMLFSQKPSNASDTSLGELWARGKADAEACAANAGEAGAVLTTAFVARDLMQVVDALDEDGLLRYYGFSYGTTLGATTAAMFPDRIDKMILDAVQNVHEYYHAQGNFEEWEVSDELFSTIFRQCIEAGPELCSLASYNKTAEELEAAAWELLDVVKYQPVAVGELVVDYAALKGMFAQNLYSSRSWPDLINILDHLAFGGESATMPLDTILSGLPAINTTSANLPSMMDGDTALAGIYCSDNQVRTERLADFLPAVKKLYTTSRVMGDVAVGSYARCQQWKIEPKETYTGGFDVQTKNPVLFIGNTLDGHTPLQSAYNVSSGFERSVVLEVDGFGHGSTSVPSECSLRAISAYWANGTLPEPGTRCERSVQPYTSDWWPKVFRDAGVNASWIVE